jgi:hypothetical protein
MMKIILALVAAFALVNLAPTAMGSSVLSQVSRTRAIPVSLHLSTAPSVKQTESRDELPHKYHIRFINIRFRSRPDAS